MGMEEWKSGIVGGAWRPSATGPRSNASLSLLRHAAADFAGPPVPAERRGVLEPLQGRLPLTEETEWIIRPYLKSLHGGSVTPAPSPEGRGSEVAPRNLQAKSHRGGDAP